MKGWKNEIPWEGRALLVRQNCKEDSGGQILPFLVLLSVFLFPLKKAKLKWLRAGPVIGKGLEGSGFRHTGPTRSTAGTSDFKASPRESRSRGS